MGSFGHGKLQHEPLDCVSWSLLAIECRLAPTNAAFGRFTGADLGFLAFVPWKRSLGSVPLGLASGG